jgi:folate-dependent phosphoribosylglycinamide formyltransferase PurN
MEPTPIFSPEDGRCMRVACFVSGSGTNARRIIEGSQEEVSGYKVVLVFSDVRDDRKKRDGSKRCRAKEIADEHGIAYECVDIRDFYGERGVKRAGDLTLRPEFDRLVLEAIGSYEIDVIALAGYMSVTTAPLLEAYSGRILNVHPADLSLMDGDERRYVGIHVVRDAILNGETELRASTHIAREKVDHGEILVISEPVPVELPEGVTLGALKEDRKIRREVVGNHQDSLKRQGDWVLYPLTLKMIAGGRFALAGEGNLYLDGVKAPHGLRL